MVMPAHPRSRGENSARVTRGLWACGSSPLTRGKHPRVGREDRIHGLIPAHAGKTPFTLCASHHPPAHPRSRGENRGERVHLYSFLGSSPLTRGKRELDRLETRRQRLIPAHAGKTASCAQARRMRAAHPRSRGENPAARTVGRAGSGSSPLTRGKQGLPEEVPGRVGLIPAHAGKTSPASRARCQVPAHPRSRGENRL